MDKKQIRAARLKMQLSQLKFAQELGVARLTVGAWERGKQIPNMMSMAKIKALAGLDG